MNINVVSLREDQLLNTLKLRSNNRKEIFINLKKHYDSIHQDSLQNIMIEFGVPKKLIRLIRMCTKDAQYQTRIDQTTSETFSVETGPKK